MFAQEMSIASTGRDYARSAWLVEGPATAHPLCVLLDGELYRDRVEAIPVLAMLMRHGEIPPLTLLVLSNGDAAARHVDYLGDPGFSRFVAEDVVSRVREEVPSLSAEGHLICGLSLSGLAAAHIVLRYPAVFPAALCQSGSFWHEPDAFADLARQHPPVGTRFWLSVGDAETEVDVRHPPTGLYQGISQIQGVERACAVLAETGADLHCHRFQGGHDLEHWRAELSDALPWLLRPR